ncbi:hypothetical protein D9M68_683130 [compost metagenome]
MAHAHERGGGQRAQHADGGQQPQQRLRGVVRHPGTGFAHHGLAQGVGQRSGIDHRADAVTVDALQPDTGANEADHHEQRGAGAGLDGASLHHALGAVRQVGGALQRDHGAADHARQQGERVEQLPERACVGGDQEGVELERHALQQVAKGHAEDHRRDEASDEEAPVPGAAPGGVVDLAAVVETHRAEEQRPQHREHGPVEAAERGGVDQRPGREDGAAAGDEPDLIAVPVRADGVDDDTALDVAAADEGQQRAHAHVVAVHDGEADEQHAHEQPPDQFEGFVVEHGDLLQACWTVW